MGHWGARDPLDLQQFNFCQCTLANTKSDSDYNVDSRLLTFVPLL